MKITLVANLSANGQLLLAGNPNYEPAMEALGFSIGKAVEAGNIVIGKSTFNEMQQFPGGVAQIFPGVEVVILSGSKDTPEGYKVAATPAEAVEYLKEKGFGNIMVGGGTQTYNVFLEMGLVTDIYFDYIPIIIGDGGIMGTGDLFLKFKLVEHKLLTDDIAQIHLTKA